MRFLLAQINPKVGDLKGNCRKILTAINKAQNYKPDIIAFPELCLPGYPPEDLLLKKHFIADTRRFLNTIVAKAKTEAILIIGTLNYDKGSLYNSAAIVHKNRLKGFYHKIHLPNYGVFDEKRYFVAGSKPMILNVNGHPIGITICEDIWMENGPHIAEVKAGAKVLLNISASPYHRGKINERIEMLKKIAQDWRVWILYVNIVGGQDELIFDGASIIIAPEGELIQLGAQFQEEFLIADIRFPKQKIKLTSSIEELKIRKKISSSSQYGKRDIKLFDEEEEIYHALVLGTRDYVRKNNFQKVVIGLSGGIDSSLTTVIAVDALGKENIIAVAMPSEFSSPSSLYDAQTLAKNLGIKLLKIPINEIYQSYLKTLKPLFKGLAFDKTEENIQARIRGNILMALSNKFGWLVLTTGNKSETSTGYCTLYGDMAGGFAVIKDVPKTMVYRLAEWRNKREGFDLIPRAIFEKSPSAELRPGQKDQDTLPPYEDLDKIIHSYIEEDKGKQEILNLGYPKSLVEKVIRMIDRSEYKRRQSPPGIKITPKAFGKDRRMPITNGYNQR